MVPQEIALPEPREERDDVQLPRGSVHQVSTIQSQGAGGKVPQLEVYVAWGVAARGSW